MYNATQPNLVQCLHDAGYRTGIIGKIHVSPKTAFPFDFKRITTSNFARQHLKKYATEASTFFTESSQPFFLAVNYPDAHRPFTQQVAGLPAKAVDGIGCSTAQLHGARFTSTANRDGQLLQLHEPTGSFDWRPAVKIETIWQGPRDSGRLLR